MKKFVLITLIVLVVAIVAAACAPAPTPVPPPAPTTAGAAPTTAPAPAPAGVKVLRMGRVTYPDVLDPQKSSYGVEIEVLKLTYEGLLAINEKGEIGPGGADKWSSSADGTSMTFHIRDGMKRFDGTAITAKDYEYALKREVDPCVDAKQYTSILYDVKGAADLDALDCKKDAAKLDAAWANYGVKALDNSNLQVTFANPVGFWQYIAYTWVTYPSDQKKVDADPENWWTKPTGHNGNGPYMPTVFDQGKRIVYQANPNYWRGKPKIDRIEVTYSTDALVMLEAYKKGEVDIDGYVVAENLASINADATLSKEFVRQPAAVTFGMAFNNQAKPFDNANVRKAFSNGFDRETYIRDVLKGIGKPYTRWIPPGVPGAQETVPGVPGYDAKAAVNGLVTNGFAAADSTADKPKIDCTKLGTLKLTYAATATNHARFQAIAGNYVKLFGCPVTLDPVDPTVYTALTKDIKTQPLISVAGWIQDYPHPQNWLSVYWTCNGFAKRYGWCNKDFDATTAKADQTIDMAAAIKLYQQAENILVGDVPSAFLYYTENLTLIHPWVIGPKDHTGSSDAEWAGEWGPVWTYDIDLTKVPAGYPTK